MRSNNNNETTQTEERKKEKERERPLFPFHARKNALLKGALCVCAGVHKKTILINLNTTSAQLFISLDFFDLLDFLLSRLF